MFGRIWPALLCTVACTQSATPLQGGKPSGTKLSPRAAQEVPASVRQPQSNPLAGGASLGDRPERDDPRALAARPCGELGCQDFDSLEAAVAYVLRSQPRVLAVGEIHAPKALPQIEPTVLRFTRVLPSLAVTARDLVLELLLSNGQCGNAEKQVEAKTAPIRESQAGTNQNQYVELGFQAKALGIQPRGLTVSCEQYAHVAGAGASDIDQLLTLVSDRIEQEVTALLTQRSSSLIVVYGGALHNDLHPRPGRENWSFGPGLSRASKGAYAELDLIVPEYVKDSETFRSQRWFAMLPPREQSPRAFRLLNPEPGSFALIFPWSA